MLLSTSNLHARKGKKETLPDQWKDNTTLKKGYILRKEKKIIPMKDIY